MSKHAVWLDVQKIPWLNAAPTRALLDALGTQNARFVGGCVRDALLGEASHDRDVATLLKPEMVVERVSAAGLRAIPTGIAHGTVTVLSGTQRYEVTTLRQDIETDGRRARVAFTDDWQSDAARRDFTINALYADAQGQVFDYFGGVADLFAGCVRFIGDGEQRILEDGLRILRFFRFSARFSGSSLHQASYVACIKRANVLQALSRERIRDELLKMLETKAPMASIQAMIAGRIVDAFLPQAQDIARLAQLVSLEQALFGPLPLDAVPPQAGSGWRRLVALLGWPDVRNLEALAQRFKASTRERKRLMAMGARAWHTPPATPKAQRAALYQLGVVGFCDQLLLSNPRLELARNALDLAQNWPIPRFPIQGRALLAQGVQAGPQVSAALRWAEQAWIEADFSQEAEVLARLVREAVRTTAIDTL